MDIKKYQIELNEINLYSYHGVLPVERKVGAWFQISLRLTLSNNSSVESDVIDDTVSYAEIYKIVCNEMRCPSKTLEHIAGRVIKEIFNHHQSIVYIYINIKKTTPPMGGDGMSAGVILEATR